MLSQSKHSDLSYEDGLIRIEEKAPSVGIRLFSEEMLLRHAHSVVSQVRRNQKLIWIKGAYKYDAHAEGEGE